MLIKCTECGKEISDQATNCPHCGAPVAVAPTSTNVKEGISDTLPKKTNKNSSLGIIALIFSVIGCTFIIGVILAVIDLLQKDGKKKTCSVIALAMCGLWIIIGLAFNAGKGNNTDDTSQEVSATVSNDNETDNSVQTEKESKEQISEESKEDFIASCEEFDYKTLARTPDDYKGKHIKLTVKVSQIMQGGFLDKGEYYRTYTNDEYDIWAGDEYLISDGRKDKGVKILEDDIVTVYGEFDGTRTMERALTGVKEDVLTVKAIYIELAEDSKGDTSELSGEELNKQIDVKEYHYINSIGSAQYFLVLKNNSNETISVTINATAKDAEGKLIGAATGSEDAIPSGYEVCVSCYFSDAENAESFEYMLDAKKDKNYKPVIQDLSFEESRTDEKVIISCTNNGDDAAEFVEATALFFLNGELVYSDSTYITDDDSEIKPGKTIIKEMTSYKEYDDVKIYLSGRK